MKTIAIILSMLFLVSCYNDTSMNGFVLTDKNTGREYLLKHSIGDNYFIYEKRIIIIGKDTTYAFDK